MSSTCCDIAERVDADAEVALALELCDARAHGRDPSRATRAGELEEQLVLRVEVRVEGTARESGALADRLDGCRIQPDLGEHLRGGIEEPSARRSRPACRDDGRSSVLLPLGFTRHTQRCGGIRLYDTSMYRIQRCIEFSRPSSRRIDPEALCPLCCTRSVAGRTGTRGACLVAWLLLLGIAGGGAAGVRKGTDNSFTIPGTESQAGLEQLSRTFPQASGTSAQIIVVAADGDSVDDEPYTTAIDDTIARLEDLDGILAVTDPFDEMVTGLVSDDGDAAIVRLQFDGQATGLGRDQDRARRSPPSSRDAPRRHPGRPRRRPVLAGPCRRLAHRGRRPPRSRCSC